MLCVRIAGDQQFLKFSSLPVWHQQPGHGQTHWNDTFSPFQGLMWHLLKLLTFKYICMILYIVLQSHNWIIAWMCRCTGVPNKVDNKCTVYMSEYFCILYFSKPEDWRKIMLVLCKMFSLFNATNTIQSIYKRFWIYFPFKKYRLPVCIFCT